MFLGPLVLLNANNNSNNNNTTLNLALLFLELELALCLHLQKMSTIERLFAPSTSTLSVFTAPTSTKQSTTVTTLSQDLNSLFLLFLKTNPRLAR